MVMNSWRCLLKSSSVHGNILWYSLNLFSNSDLSGGQCLKYTTLQIPPKKQFADKLGDPSSQVKIPHHDMRQCRNISCNFSLLIPAV